MNVSDLGNWGTRTRLGMAWHVLRGRPLAYRITVEGSLVAGDRTVMRECRIEGGGIRVPPWSKS